MPTLTTTGKIGFPAGVSTSELLAHLADCLRDVSAKEVRVEGNSVSFVGGVFRFVTNWNVLAPFGFGDLTIYSANSEVSFRLSYRQLVVYTGIMFLLVGAVLLFIGLPPASWLILAAPIIYLIAVISNIAVGVLHFRYFLRRSISTGPAPNQ
jgi:hypothetical protein